MKKRMGMKEKQVLYDEFFKICKEWEPIDDELFKLVEEGKLKSGCLLVYTKGRNYGYNNIMDTYRDNGREYHWQNVTGWNLQYYINDMKKGLEFTRELIANTKKEEGR